MSDLPGKYKTYKLNSPFKNRIYTAHSTNVEYILKTISKKYGKVHNYDIWHPQIIGIFCVVIDVPKWYI